MGVGIYTEDRPGVSGKGKAVITDRVAEEDGHLDIIEVAGEEPVKAVVLRVRCHVDFQVLQSGGDGVMFFEDEGRPGACAVGEAKFSKGEVFR